MVSHSLDVLGRIIVPVPDAVVERALSFTGTPVPPRPSASVILIRESGRALEVYLMHRHARMAFAASMVAFPGGGVDPADHDQPGDPVLACAVRELQEETGVRLPPGDLAPWAHWVTPEVEPRRYDTWFFLAVVPEDQEPADVSGEASAADWATPAETLAAHRAGALGLMPPTLSILVELAGLGSVAAVLAAAADRVVEPVLPVPERVGDRWLFRYPGRD
ncbi:NUDIX hydrolase [Microlunatus parietis]|uniref:8-oxo-dGTP pyrophosphatase MutT (NUDIX family) n=1 Tax=Microlunatus parietis TaxID=682979 RepID=A0A7Y9I8G5_9ACTN|nr:NUDIX hydrolase [Microlunatus parietis]NYE71659.1 8-oxo-dGTP pyrophosphatase MutT (NUDIX family) [Microlunatus parietis]